MRGKVEVDLDSKTDAISFQKDDAAIDHAKKTCERCAKCIRIDRHDAPPDGIVLMDVSQNLMEKADQAVLAAVALVARSDFTPSEAQQLICAQRMLSMYQALQPYSSKLICFPCYLHLAA